jgi:hypothetical protein
MHDIFQEQCLRIGSDMINTPAGTIKKKRTATFRRWAGLVLAALAVSMLLQPGRANADGSLAFACVNASRLNVRASASARTRALLILSRGDVVRVTASKTVSGVVWCKVESSGGTVGWCQARYLSMQAEGSAFKPSNNALLDWPSEYISLSKTFTFQRCMQDMGEIAAAYPELARLETIGTSVMGNPIQAIVLGNPGAEVKILVQATIHARELISSGLALRQAESMLKAATAGAFYKNVKISDLLNSVEIWVVPMANPDGVRLVYEGLAAVPSSMPELAVSLKAMNKGKTSFYRWKANAHGVDLNRNFSGYWAPDPKHPKPGSENYAGPYPFSEPESIALRDLSDAQNFALSLSYHASGKVIYWNDPSGGQNDLNLYIAKKFRALNGYKVLPVAQQDPGGGYRDWFEGQFSRPGFTIEVGKGYCPLPMSSFSAIWKGNRFVMLEAAWIVAPKGLSAYAGS